MSLNEIIENFKKYPKNMGYGSGKLAVRMKTTPEIIRQAKEIVRKLLPTPTNLDNALGVVEIETEHSSGNQRFVINSEKPLSPKEIEELVQADNISIFVDRSWLKSHKNGSWTYSVLTVNKVKDFTEGKFLEILKNIKFAPIQITKANSHNNKESVDIEVSIADFHLDRQTLKQDDIEKRSTEYINTVKQLLLNVSGSYEVDNCVFTIGNDFLNSDNYHGSTTNLTQQDNSVSWDKAYEVAFTTLATSINILKSYCKTVNVLLINGNHDRTKMYYIAHALSTLFEDNHDVIFDRSVSNLKHIELGNTFIGYHHGNCKIDELPLVFATSPGSCSAFGNATYREVHTADKHFYMEKEIKGVRILQTPSMVNPDRWSSDNNFINQIRAGLVLVYHPTKGRVALFEHRL